jgi:hypothetical protein
MVITATRLAASMLDSSGIKAIWDAHLAAAAAYGLGKHDLAETLVEIAEAAEREWTRREELAPTGKRTAAQGWHPERP